MKITKKPYTYETAKGETRNSYNFYLVLDNGCKIAIKPSFSDGYSQLKLIAESED